MYRTCFVALVALTPPAFASDTTPLPYTYDIFEASVPHLDLAECPAELAQTGGFCRAAVLNDLIHVYVFAEDGDQPLIGYGAYDAPDLSQTLQ